MRTIYLKILDFKIKINLLSGLNQGPTKIAAIKQLEKQLETYLKPFISPIEFKKCDFIIDIDSDYTELDTTTIQNGQNIYMLMYKHISKNKIKTFYQIGIYQFGSIFQGILIDLLSKSSGFNMHCSAVLDNSSIILFMGRSGAGKSTISNLLNENYPKVADDISLIKKTGSNFFFYEGPEISKNWANRTANKYHIRCIYFLKKANKSWSEKISKEKALKILLESTRIKNRATIKSVMEFTDQFNEFYNLYFTKNKQEILKFMENTKK
ncbi:MAG TPA: hypothetical protein VG917_00275 [Patescibacteria group bacterium]|nr:hypothetical protein [Patescibacteria group bacterium]